VEARWLAFLAVAAILTITPGPDMAIVTRSALDGGWRAAVRTTLGINAGVLLWALAAAIGVAAVIEASAVAFTVLKLGGAVYLVVLGVRSLRVHAAAAPEDEAEAGRGRSRGGPFRRGLITNLLNPKIAVFYSTFLPQFVDPHHSFLLQAIGLALAHNLMGLIWLPTYARIVIAAGDVLRRPRVRRALDRVTGIVLVAFGVRLAVQTRR
jgi:RhtB (resistance to homoserine/threonine) family protein